MLKLASLLRKCTDALVNPFVTENLGLSGSRRRVGDDVVNLLLIESAISTLVCICIVARCKYLKSVRLVLCISH